MTRPLLFKTLLDKGEWNRLKGSVRDMNATQAQLHRYLESLKSFILGAHTCLFICEPRQEAMQYVGQACHM